MNSLFYKMLPPFVGFMVFVLALLVSLVIKDTVVYNPPFETFNDSAEVIKYPDYTVFAYKRELTIAYDIYGMVDRFVMHGPSGRTIQIESSGQIYKKAVRRPVYREFRLPARLESGEWCLHAYLKYRPGLSLRDHVFEAQPVCANV